MAITFASFVADRPEFVPAGQTLIESTIAQAALRISADSWGTGYDTAHSLMTAHLLWTSPFGSSMRLDGDSSAGRSRYLEEFERLRVELIPRIMVLR